MLKRKQVEIDGIGDIEVTELSAKAYSEMLNARKEGKLEVEVSATVAYYCAFKDKYESVDAVLEAFGPAVLIEIMQHVIELSELKPKKSVADRATNSSTA
jgi:hypothetical protein